MAMPDLRPTVETIPRLAFDTFMSHFQWQQGQHLAIIGPTNSGKTTLAHALLPHQPYVTVFATKPADDSMDKLAGPQRQFLDVLQKKEGYKVYQEWPTSWPDNSNKRFPRRIIWPPIDSLSKEAENKQREILSDAMAKIYKEGGWCLYLDELWWIIQQLSMGREVKSFLLQGRSMKISLAVATQRPYWVPLEVYDQSTHLFFFKDQDEANLRRLGGISWRSADLIRKTIVNLNEHEFLYVFTPKGGMVRSQVGRGA